MKKNKNWFVLFGILSAIAVALYFSDNTSTYRRTQIEFSVKDVQDIEKIIITQQSDTFELKKNAGQWVYSNFSVARKEALINLFRLIGEISAKAPIRGNFDDQFKNGASVSIFDHEKLLKKYIIAEDTLKHITIGRIVGSNQVFEIEALGYPPRILPFFRTDKLWWRDLVILKQNPEQIKSITLQNLRNPDLSFVIRNYGKGQFGVVQGKSDKLLQNVSSDRLIQYLQLYTNIEVSEYIDSEKVDSIISLQNQMFTIAIESISSESFIIEAYEKVGDSNQFFIFTNKSQLSIAKYVVFDLLIVHPNFFCK